MGYPIKTGQSAWVYKAIPNFLGGMSSAVRPDELQDNQTVMLRNVIAKQGAIINDSGYVPFVQAIIGTPQAEARFVRQDGSVETILITTKTVYKYNSNGPQWALIKGSTSTTTTANCNVGATVIPVTSVAGFSNGDVVGVILNDGTEFQSTTTISGSTLVLASGLPQNSPSGATVTRGVQLTGDLDHEVSYDTYAGNDWFVFTNQVQHPQRYDGTDCVDVPNLPSAGAVTCSAIVTYNAALFLLGTVEGGVNHPQRIRRSNQGDPTDWTGGTSGSDDLLDSAQPIVTGKRLGPYLIVYRTNSIVRGQFIGASGLNYEWDTMTDADGALSTNSVVEVDDGTHIVFGNNGAYSYVGDFGLPDISSSIFYDIWGAGGNLDPLNKIRSFAIYVPELKEVWFFYPSTGESLPNVCWKFNTMGKIWYRRDYADTFIAAGLFQAENDISWDALIGSWDDQTWTWDSQITSEVPFNVHLLGSNGQVFAYDYKATLDNGVAIQYTVETKDYLIQDANLRFDMFEAFMQGTDVQIDYSTDAGVSWNRMGTVTQVPEDRIRLFSQFFGKRCRFRFSGTSTNFLLEWAGLSYKIESIYG